MRSQQQARLDVPSPTQPPTMAAKLRSSPRIATPPSNKENVALAEPNRTIDFEDDFETGVRTAARAIEDAHERRKQEIKRSFSHSGGNLNSPREWELLGDLTKEEIAAWLCKLTARAATAQSNLFLAIKQFEFMNNFFALPIYRTPNTIEGVHNMLRAYREAAAAGHKLFHPQSEYQAAVTALRLFVADLVELLPKASQARKLVTPLFNDMMKKSAGTEGRLRRNIEILGAGSGHVREKVKGYLTCVEARSSMLREEEVYLVQWAKACVDDIPTA